MNSSRVSVAGAYVILNGCLVELHCVLIGVHIMCCSTMHRYHKGAVATCSSLHSISTRADRDECESRQSLESKSVNIRWMMLAVDLCLADSTAVSNAKTPSVVGLRYD